ncbi:MAG: hypothetical protein ACJ76F_13785 [Bacteroidia bacterium]
MEKTKQDLFIPARPRVYSWLNFQRILLWLFCINGIIAFSVFIFKLSISILEMMLIERAGKEIAMELNRQEMQNKIEILLIRELEPLKTELLIYLLSVCLLFFILARYCQKVINRNKYILELEGIIKREADR